MKWTAGVGHTTYYGPGCGCGNGDVKSHEETRRLTNHRVSRLERVRCVGQAVCKEMTHLIVVTTQITKNGGEGGVVALLVDRW